MDKSAARGGWPGQLVCSSLTVPYLDIHKEIKHLTPTEGIQKKLWISPLRGGDGSGGWLQTGSRSHGLSYP